jgi:hypothetical protein
MRSTILAVILLAGACGKHGTGGGSDAPATSDAGVGDDAPGSIDAPVDGTGGDATGSTADCTTYCNAIQAACVGGNAQYSSVAICVASCTKLPAGTSGATSGNSLACRDTHRQLAQTTPSTHCVHAGPSGGGTCGTACEGFCAIAAAACPAESPPASCATECAALPPAPPYNATITSGDSLECRLYYATLAALDPATSCVETGQNSTMCQ